MGKNKNTGKDLRISFPLTQESSKAFRREMKFLGKWISWELEFLHMAVVISLIPKLEALKSKI